MGSPVNVPETFFVVGTAVVFVADGVGLAVALFVAAGVGVALFVVVTFVPLLAAELLVVAALFVAAGAAAGELAGVAVVVDAAGAKLLPKATVLSDEVN